MKGINFLLVLIFITACSSHSERPDPKDPNYDVTLGLYSKRDEFRSCYLESDSYQGRHFVEERIIKVAFTIEKDGKINNPKIAETPFKDPNLNACIIGILKLVKYEAPKNGEMIQVLQPINFYPRIND